MGGVSIAMTDTLLDPFVNPAMGARLGAARFFSSPTVYSISSGAGGGRTLPFGAMMRSGRWYGGLALALQEVDVGQRNTPIPQFLGIRGSIAPAQFPEPGAGSGKAAGVRPELARGGAVRLALALARTARSLART